MPTGKLILTGLLLWLIFCHTASADLYFKMPQIGGLQTTNLEWGASPKITIGFKNTYGKKVYVTDVEFNLNYDPKYISSLIDFKNLRSDKLAEVGVDYLSTPKLIKYQMKALTGIPALEVDDGAAVDLLTITFHLNQDYNIFTKNFSLFQWSALVPSGIYWSGTNVAGIPQRCPLVNIYPYMPPRFAGLDSATSPNTGNSIILNWGTSGQGALIKDWRTLRLGVDSLTPYYRGEWHYKVYRAASSDLTDALLLSPDIDHNLEADPDLRIPYTGNELFTKYKFNDNNPDNPPKDGQLYYYWVTASNNDSPLAIETPRSAWHVLNVRSLDTTPPMEVSSLTAISDDIQKAITLSWINPNDPDQGGVIILRTESSSFRPNLGRASFTSGSYTSGPEYFPDQMVGDAKVIYVSPQEENYALVPREYMDYDPEYGKTYYYWICTYDPVTDIQMGRNFSRGVSVRQALGQPPAYEIPPMEGLPYEEFSIITKKPALGPGINTFSLPYPLYSFADSNGNPVDISTVSKLVLALDQGKHYIRSLGWWDENLQQPMGISKIEWSGSEPRFTFLPGTNADTPVQFARAYQMTISDPNNPEGALNYVITFKIIF